MKNLLLTLITFVLISTGINATTTTNTDYNYYNTYNKSFTFIERGITFAVFQNGEFDFFLNQPNGIAVNYNSPNVAISFNSGHNYNAYVQYDRYGAVIQVENTPIYYDYYGRVSKIGNIHINYNNGRLVQLGGLHVHYNNYGYFAYNRGYINSYNRHYNHYSYQNCFVTPHYNYRVVSYKAYRNHYKPYRYNYHKDHSKNKYYSRNDKHFKNESRKNYSNYNKNENNKYNKRGDYASRERVATKIPKRSESNTNTNRSRYATSRDNFSKNNNYDRVRNSSNKVNTSISKNRSSTQRNRNDVVKNSNSFKNPQRAIGQRKPITKVDSKNETYKRAPIKRETGVTKTRKTLENNNYSRKAPKERVKIVTERSNSTRKI